MRTHRSHYIISPKPQKGKSRLRGIYQPDFSSCFTFNTILNGRLARDTPPLLLYYCKLIYYGIFSNIGEEVRR